MTLPKHISDELREKFQYWDLSSEENLSELGDFIAQTLETEVQRACLLLIKKFHTRPDVSEAVILAEVLESLSPKPLKPIKTG